MQPRSANEEVKEKKMSFGNVKSKMMRLPWTVALLVILLGLMLTNIVSANSLNDELMWITVCHTPPDNPEVSQTMVLYWSALDKCLSHFGDFIGSCP
jgi:hypothetical protein